ncbi:MAG TPA: DUF1295 domain-containing protein, partial [Terriglobia bacterium]
LSRIPAPTWTSVALYGGWFLLQALLQVVAPGRIHEGIVLADGARLKYKMNGWFTFWFTMAAAGAAAGFGWIPATIFYDQFGPLLTTVNIFAFAFGVFLYLHGKNSKTQERRTGSPFCDYFTGTALNPRVGSFDFKLFCEARPGLILWILINLSFAAKQYQLHGTVTVPMILVNAFHFLYIADYYFHEEAILTTWDIKHENFGWMLCWGDLVWVPFMYTLQAHYLIDHTHELSVPTTVAIVALNLAGFVIFRGANIQKHKFRKNPDRPVWGKPAQYIETSRGTLLLTSGWWGIARHTNYLGDLMMGLAWCLPTGFEHPLPYFYILYFTILLLNREWRDNLMCSEKYGKDWESYCRKVPWRIVPGVY